MSDCAEQKPRRASSLGASGRFVPMAPRPVHDDLPGTGSLSACFLFTLRLLAAGRVRAARTIFANCRVRRLGRQYRYSQGGITTKWRTLEVFARPSLSRGVAVVCRRWRHAVSLARTRKRRAAEGGRGAGEGEGDAPLGERVFSPYNTSARTVVHGVYV